MGRTNIIAFMIYGIKIKIKHNDYKTWYDKFRDLLANRITNIPDSDYYEEIEDNIASGILLQNCYSLIRVNAHKNSPLYVYIKKSQELDIDDAYGIDESISVDPPKDYEVSLFKQWLDTNDFKQIYDEYLVIQSI